MPVFVVATATPLAGRLQTIIDAYEAVTPAVHAERGCELYAVHTDDAVVVIVERWSTLADLEAHAAGEPVAELGRLVEGALAEPIAVRILEGLPFGDPVKGTLA